LALITGRAIVLTTGMPVAYSFGLVPLLNRLALDDEGLLYVGQILAAFPSSTSGIQHGKQAGSGTEGQQGPVDPLSKREQEVLDLMARHLTNKEIGAQLFISPGTVKRHTENIYSKLAVNGRREAVAKAIGLGIINKN